MRALVAGALLSLVGCHGADRAESSGLNTVTAELRPEQVDESKFVERDGARTLPEGANYERVFLLRGTGADRDALVATSGQSVTNDTILVGGDHERTAFEDGELRVGVGQVQVQFHDGRVWLGFPAGAEAKVPYVDDEGNVLLLDREQLFGTGDAGGDLRDPAYRIPLERLLADDTRFQPFGP